MNEALDKLRLALGIVSGRIPPVDYTSYSFCRTQVEDDIRLEAEQIVFDWLTGRIKPTTETKE